MREQELWRRLRRHLGEGYAPAWAEFVALDALGSTTVVEALGAGVPARQVWRAVWEHLQLPPSER